MHVQSLRRDFGAEVTGELFATDPASQAGMRGAAGIRRLSVAILDHQEQP